MGADGGGAISDLAVLSDHQAGLNEGVRVNLPSGTQMPTLMQTEVDKASAGDLPKHPGLTPRQGADAARPKARIAPEQHRRYLP